MREFSAGSYDVAVIGAGHAGIEASLACARLGMKTVCFTINLDAVGNMPCNPAIGGTGKGHLVRELDALGGEMAKAADLACIQYRSISHISSRVDANGTRCHLADSDDICKFAGTDPIISCYYFSLYHGQHGIASSETEEPYFTECVE